MPIQTIIVRLATPIPIGSGSFSNVFTVDARGQFQTVQAAIDYISVLAAGNDPPDAVVIDIGVNSFTETLTLDNSTGTWPIIIFKGVTNNGNSDINATQSKTFETLTITGDGNQLDVRVKDCCCGLIHTDSPLVLIFDNGNSNGNAITSLYSGSNGLTIGSMYGGGNGFTGTILADDTDILLFGITADAPGGSLVTSANGNVTIADSGQAPEGTTFGSYTPSFFSINAPNGTVRVNDSLLQDVTCRGDLTLVRSQILGTLTRVDPMQVFTSDQYLTSKNGIPDVNFIGFGKGSLCIDTVNGKLYINGGDAITPNWKLVTSA